jgi:uncharacterized membrane protein
MAADVQPGAPAPAANNESLTALVTGILHDAEQLFKQQVTLLKHEVREDVRKTAVASAPLVAGGVVLALGVFFVLLGVPLLLAWALPAVPLWAWFMTWGAIIAVAGAVLLYAGKKKFDSFNPLPVETAEALKENVQWIMKPKRSASRWTTRGNRWPRSWRRWRKRWPGPSKT